MHCIVLACLISARHSTSAEVIRKMIPSAACCSWEFEYSVDDMKRYSEELNELRKERKKLKAVNCGILDGIDPTLLSSDNIYHGLKPSTPGDLRVVIDDVRFSCLNLGEQILPRSCWCFTLNSVPGLFSFGPLTYVVEIELEIGFRREEVSGAVGKAMECWKSTLDFNFVAVT